MTEKTKLGIWKFARVLPPVDKKYQKTLNEGSTPLVEKEGVFFKCEWKNPTGSVKDRSLCYQTAVLKSKNKKRAVLSSSGNAAISAISYCRLNGIKLHIFVSPKINRQKYQLIKSQVSLTVTKKPVSSAVKFAHQNNYVNLRQSTDPNAIIGYQTISFELAKENPLLDAIFIPVSSGTILVGIAKGLVKMKKNPAIHAVQSTLLHTISAHFDKDFRKESSSLADSLVARYTPLEREILTVIKKSKGWGWVVSNKEMEFYRQKLVDYGLKTGFEGAAAFAAFSKAREKGYRYKNPVCLLTGKYYQP